MSQAASEGQAPSGNSSTSGQGQEPPANTGTEGQEPPVGDQSGEFDLSKVTDPAVKAYLTKVQKDAQDARSEAAKYRTERNALTEQVTQQQRANETAEQKAQREQQERDTKYADLERENRDLKVGTAVREAATTAKAFNPTTVYAMIRDKVVLDEQGKAANVDDLIKDLKKSDPYLFKRAAGADAGAGGGDDGQVVTMNDAIRRAAGRS